jgi:Transposase IS66 family
MPPPFNPSGLPRALLEAQVVDLLGENSELKQIVAAQRDEIARLKGLKGRPSIKPSGMEKGSEPKRGGKRSKRRRRGKVTPRVTPETEVLRIAHPTGSQFKGYEPYQVQELVLTARVVHYRRERWLTPDGETIVAPLPSGIRGHFGPELRRFVLMQYHQGQVTVERLVAQLQAFGISISKRQLMRLLIDRQDDFLTETREVLRAGLETADWITVDDTGARHRGANGVCTHMWTAPSLQGLCSALIRSLAFICPACSVGAHAGTPAKMVSATRVPNRYGDLTEGHCVQRSSPCRGSIDHAIYLLACKFWHQLSTVAVSCSPCLADL